MMKSFLLDTSILIDFLRVKDKKQTLLYKLAKKNYTFFISIVTHSELYEGRNVWKNQYANKELEILLTGITILPLDIEISRLAGKIRTKHHIALIDAIIAATALQNKLSLATLNVKDFKKIDALELLKIT